MTIVRALPIADTWGMHGDIGWGWMVAMMAAMVVFWGAIILGVIWLVRAGVDSRSGRPSGTSPDSFERRETPSELLERRFAEGAIDVEDYQVRRRILAHGGGEENGT
jgi:putative membrane protein